MIALNLQKLKALQAFKGWERFYFLSENQYCYDFYEPLKANLAFTGMMVYAEIPQAVYFTMPFGKGNCMMLKFVTDVECKPHIMGDLLVFSCMGGEEYIIVAQ